MAVDITLNDVTSGFSRSLINTNFQLIETALQDALSRSGDSPNTLAADIDLNSNDLLNVGTTNTSVLKVAGVTVTDATYVPDWKGPWVTATSYVINDLISEAGSTYICLIAHTSGTFSTDLTSVKWELFAQQGGSGAGTGDMLAANDLSDVANAATSRSNLGLGDIAVLNLSGTSTYTGTVDVSGATLTLANNQIAGAKVAAATTTTEGVVEKATSAEGTTPVADKYGDTVVVAEMIEGRGFNGQLLHVQDQKTAGTNGGSSATGSFTKRDLNTTLTNEITGATLTTSVVSLPPGTYYAEGFSPFNQTNDTAIKLRDTTNSTDLIIGNGYNFGTSGDSKGDLRLAGRFTLAGTANIELQYNCTTINTIDGLGEGTSLGLVGVFTDLRIWRVS